MRINIHPFEQGKASWFKKISQPIKGDNKIINNINNEI
jgi:hypothetical protein